MFWEALDFTNSPFDHAPLRCDAADVPLLIGRFGDSVKLHTLLDSRRDGVCIISGPPGVGKTSFLNVQQFLIEAGKTNTGPRLLACRAICTVPSDSSTEEVKSDIAFSLNKSIIDYCALHGKDVPRETKSIQRWLKQVDKRGTGLSLSFQVLGTGAGFSRTVQLPPVSDASLYDIRTTLDCMSSEVVNKLRMDGCLIVLDNMENLSDQSLRKLLLRYRDTLFECSNIWWVLIGQSGLEKHIYRIEPKVSERIVGSGIELQPLNVGELHSAISERIRKFSRRSESVSPISKELMEDIFKSSRGEIRFTLKTCNDICIEFATTATADLGKLYSKRRPANNTAYYSLIKKTLINGVFPSELSSKYLIDVISSKFPKNELSKLDIIFLKEIFDAKDSAINIKSTNVHQNTIDKLSHLRLINKIHINKSYQYTLTGLSALAFSLEIL